MEMTDMLRHLEVLNCKLLTQKIAIWLWQLLD